MGFSFPSFWLELFFCAHTELCDHTWKEWPPGIMLLTRSTSSFADLSQYNWTHAATKRFFVSNDAPPWKHFSKNFQKFLSQCFRIANKYLFSTTHYSNVFTDTNLQPHINVLLAVKWLNCLHCSLLVIFQAFFLFSAPSPESRQTAPPILEPLSEKVKKKKKKKKSMGQQQWGKGS